MISRKKNVVAVPVEEPVFVCPLGEECKHILTEHCQEYAMEVEHNKTCGHIAQGGRCEHFHSKTPEAGIPPYARYRGHQGRA